jgi:uncharacterized protein
MNRSKIIQNTICFVKESLKNSEGGHDWFHVERVYNLSKNIAKKENADLFVVALGALLHDIADSKFHDGDEHIGPKKAAFFLKEQQVDDAIIQHVVKIIENISFKGGNFSQKFCSLELNCVQDADRIDAIGAVGIARCFSYGGYKQRTLYNPEIKPNLAMSKEEYKKSTAPSINHFYEKLLLLKEKMNTTTGKKMALERHEFMQLFLDQFYKEWEGK